MRFLLALASLATAAIATDAPAASAPHKAVAPVKEAIALDKFECPAQMSYCPWTKSCSCEPGLVYDLTKSVCVGTPITGAWPEPIQDPALGITIELGAFCAASPTKIVKYDAKHRWCQASLLNIVFLADVDIDVTLKDLGISLDVEIDLHLDVLKGTELLHVCAGLQGLFLKDVRDAVILFNTDRYSLGLDIVAGISLNRFICLIGFGPCFYDCVSYCRPGCLNYVDAKVDVEGVVVDVTKTVGGTINGLVGLVILDKYIHLINHLGVAITILINDLLCLVGKILAFVFSTFNCGCK